MRRPLLLLAALTLAACGAPTQSAPKIAAVRPGAVATGATPFVTLTGSGFDPRFSVSPVTGTPALDDGFTVRFAGTASPSVVWRSPTTLVAALPPGLAAGKVAVTVTAPDGGEVQKSGALCVGALATEHRLSIIYQGSPTLPTAADLTSTPVVGDGSPQILASRVGSRGLHAFAVSPDGGTVVYLHLAHAGLSVTEQLFALHPEGTGTPILLHSEPAQQGRQVMDGFAFTPDSGTLVYVIGGQKLVTQAIPADGGIAANPTVLFDAGASSGEVVVAPSVDPTGTTVLFSRVSNPDSNGTLVGETLALYSVPLTGGKPKALVDARGQAVSNGPGVYLPSGKGILFISNRMGLMVPAQIYGKEAMVAASNLFVLDPDTGTVTAVSPPTVEAFVVPPLVVSPDGRWAAATGVLLDLTKSMLDILITDLKTGKVYRAVADVQGQSPTIDIDPSFSPDGKTLYATAITMGLTGASKIESYAVALPATDPKLPASDRTLPAKDVTTIPGSEAAPVILQTYAGCGG